jgi:hypothetical protein
MPKGKPRSGLLIVAMLTAVRFAMANVRLPISTLAFVTRTSADR